MKNGFYWVKSRITGQVEVALYKGQSRRFYCVESPCGGPKHIYEVLSDRLIPPVTFGDEAAKQKYP